MAKAIDKPTTRRAVLTGAATLALMTQTANANEASQKALVSVHPNDSPAWLVDSAQFLQPSERGRALLALLPAMAKSGYRYSMLPLPGCAGEDPVERREVEQLRAQVYGRRDQLISTILNSPRPNLIDLAIVGTFDTYLGDYEGDDALAKRHIAEHLLKLAGIDLAANHIQAHWNAYERSVGVTA